MTLPRKVLVVEDEADMAHVLNYNLSKADYGVFTARSGDDCLSQARSEKPDLILLDLRLPGVGGLNVLRELKADPETRDIPVIIVSALDSEDDVVLGLNLGAEDYVVKPFRMREVMARVAAALRRTREVEEEDREVACGEVSVNLSRHETLVDGEIVHLTPSEQNILVHLMRRPGRVFTRRQLCDHALRAGDAIQERAIDAHVRTIRRKLGPAGRRIVTVWGVGYKFVEA